jgi:7,8-dihydropterin-6-yl-methyl-4-(beta-D-ribofuranosyl)aminobenzene 5'-phosphate synthase
MRKLILLVLLFQNGYFILHAQKVKQLKITILSTMLADTAGKGEWGFSALVEADGRKILFDTGTDSSLVLNNARLCGISLSDVATIVLSHSHSDHTGGWNFLRDTLRKINPAACDTTYVGNGFFTVRFHNNQTFDYNRTIDSAKYIHAGGNIKIVDRFTEIYPGIFLTGPVPRRFKEKNYQKDNRIKSGKSFVEDYIPEDMSLIISTEKGLVLLSGCGHSGIVNTVSYMQENLKDNLYAAIGGFHLFNVSDGQISWSGDILRKAGIRYFMGAHCTGINAVIELRDFCSLDRSTCVVAAVGSVFDLSKGILPGWIAQ